MGAPQEVLLYIEALKWPVLIGGALWVGRGKIASFLDRFQLPREGSVKVTGIGELSWKDSVRKVAEEAESIGSIRRDPVAMEIIVDESGSVTSSAGTSESGSRGTSAIDWSPASDTWDLVDRLVVSDPTGAVIAAWERLNDDVYAIAYRQKANVGNHERHNALLMGTRLGLPTEMIGVIGQLRELRNRVAHAELQIAPEDALEYVQTVKRLDDQLRRW